MMKHAAGKAGFTLLELLLAVFISGLVFASIYGAYSSTLSTARDIDEDARSYKTARVALDRMTRDLSAVLPYAGEYVFVANRDFFRNDRFGNLTVWSAAHLAFGEDDVSGSPASIRYFVRENPGGQGFSLWRSDTAGVRPQPGRTPSGGVIICPDITALAFTFFDENGREHETWDSTRYINQGRAPHRVLIELVLANARRPESPLRFTTSVYLPEKR